MRKPALCICKYKGADQLRSYYVKTKGADQLRSNCAADQHLCFCYIDSTIPLLPKLQVPSHLLWLYSRSVKDVVQTP